MLKFLYSTATIFCIIINMSQKLHLEEETIFFQAFLMLIIVLIIYAISKKLHTKKRLEVVRNRPTSEINENKIIVGIELQNLLVDVSHCKRQGYTKIECQNTWLNHLIFKTKQLFGIGIYYKPKTSVKILKNHLQVFAQNPKVQLFLYTTLTLSIAEQILQKLCLKSYFKPQHRRSCSDCYNEPLKHPTEVDFNIKRVIIVTASKTDHLEQDSKYFLVVKRKQLSDSFRTLNKIIANNTDIEQLHNQLGEIKAQIESDYQNSC